MQSSESKITAKGQISIPAAVRRKLGLAPGSRIEWLEREGEIIVRRASRYSSQDIHEAGFSEPAEAVSAEVMDAGIRRRMKSKQARR